MNYELAHGRTYKIEEDGERKLLANFIAFIVTETRLVDGRSQETILTIGGTIRSPSADDDQVDEFLPETQVNASEWQSMSWVIQAWGVRAVIQPGSGIKDDLRAAIQMSSNPKIETIYRHTGWTEIKGKPIYLHAGGGIGEKGNDPSISVQLQNELSRYNLTTNYKPREALTGSLKTAMLPPPSVGWPLYAATLTPLLGPVDFAMHLTGRTGTFKSEIMSLFQSHYGREMDARHLPGSWSSTPNALEAQAYYAKDARFTVDDFVPAGTSWQVRAYQVTADKIIRSQGNQAGRARLTDTSRLQSTMHPRGIILSTGEDTPEGHSVRARMFILELTPGDIDVKKLTEAQSYRDRLPGITAAFAQWLAANPQNVTATTEQARSAFHDIGHSRTPSMIARLCATMEIFTNFLTAIKVLTPDQAIKMEKISQEAIIEAGKRQQLYLESADPCEVFLGAIRHLLGAGQGHIRTLNGGIPRSPTLLGWTEDSNSGDMPIFKSHGPLIGWIDWNNGELYIEANNGYQALKKIAGSELPLTKQTMMKRLKDNGNLTRCDEARQRNTIRITAEGHPRQVLALSIAQVLETQEIPQDDPGND